MAVSVSLASLNGKQETNMIKIYGTKEAEKALIPILAEFRVSTFTSYSIKGVTRKVRGTRRGKGFYKVVNYPI